MYHDFVKLWRKCSLAVDESTTFERDSVFHADRSNTWFCSCRSYVMNSRYICKHLVSFFASESAPRIRRVALLCRRLLVSIFNCFSTRHHLLPSTTVR
ncbi:hypothetical protein V1519DRAFT_453997 [Lipomyces tetrasporus]